MANYKLVMDKDVEEDFFLIAIHCSEESYKIAYLINKHLHLRLKRARVDLDYSDAGLNIMFSLYEYEDELSYLSFSLIANKCKSEIAQFASSGGLFDNQTADNTVLNFLIPELKQVDFFLKIRSESQSLPLRKLLASLNEIKQVISAYEVDLTSLKSKNNLIFD